MPQIAPTGGWELIGPDGTRVVFNNPNDIDHAGYLDPENGITGLLDGADVRESKDNLVEADGAGQGNNSLAARVGTIQGIINPNVDMTTMNNLEGKIKRASRALRADCSLRWTPDGSVQRQMLLRRQARVVIAGRRPKTFLIPLSAADPFAYSSALQSLVLTPTVGAGDQGFSSPISSPLTTVFSQSGQLFVVNQGDAETWPTFVIQGPITNPTMVNNSTGLSFTLTYTLQANETLVVTTKPGSRTVMFNGTTSRYSAYAANFATNVWWSLVPGTNDVRLLSAAFSVGAQVTVQWRHAWE